MLGVQLRAHCLRSASWICTFLFFALSVQVSVSVLAAPQLEAAFSVEMPSPATDWDHGADCYDVTCPPWFLAGDMLYVIAKGANALNAVNLTDRRNQWYVTQLSPGNDTISTIQATSNVVLAQFSQTVRAYDPATGEHLWSTEEFGLSANPCFNSEGKPPVLGSFLATNGSTVMMYAQKTPEELFYLYTIEARTGKILEVEKDVTAAVFYNGVYFASTNRSFEARSLASGAVLWSTGPLDLGEGVTDASLPLTPLLGVSSKYIMVSNITRDGDVMLVVLDRSNGSVVANLEAFNGLDADSALTMKPFFADDYLMCAVGVNDVRYVKVDLKTGYIVWTRTAEKSERVTVVGNYLVSLNANSLMLNISSIRGDSGASMMISHVPTMPSPSVLTLSATVFQVDNLQGYTVFDVNGTLLGRNEHRPSTAAGNAPLSYREYFLYVSDNLVTAVRVVK